MEPGGLGEGSVCEGRGVSVPRVSKDGEGVCPRNVGGEVSLGKKVGEGSRGRWGGSTDLHGVRLPLPTATKVLFPFSVKVELIVR